MKTGITKREKTLLFCAGLVLILYLSIQFAIVPLSNSYSTGTEERDRLRSERDAHDLEASMLPNLRVRSSEARERFYALTSGYSEIVPNELTDRRLTSLCTGNNMSVVALRFSPRPVVPPAPPQYDEEGNLIEPEVDDSYPVFTYVTAFMNLTGSYASLMNLIDEVAATEYIRLTNTSLTRNFQFDETSTISLTFEVTYLSDR
jgi:Tfp pilus assembly protein PilO